MSKSYGSIIGTDDSGNNNAESLLPASAMPSTTKIPSSSSSSSSSSCHSTTSTTTTTTTTTTNIPVLVTAFTAALASGGPTYAFGLYAQQLKTSLNLTQSQITTISAANFCAGLLSWIPGMCVDAWGSRTAMAVGGMMEACALVLYYVACTEFAKRETSPNITVPTLSCIGVTIFASNSLVIGALFKMMVQSCRRTKGAAVGAAKGYLGLGAGVYSVLFDCLGLENNLLFLPMAAVLCVVAIVIPAMLLLPDKETLKRHAVVEAASPRHFRIVYMGLVVLGLLVLVTSCKSLLELNHDSGNADDELEIVVTTTKKDGSARIVRALWILVAWFGPILGLFFLSNNSDDDDQENNNIDNIQHDMALLLSNNKNNSEQLALDFKTGEYLDLEKTHTMTTVSTNSNSSRSGSTRSDDSSLEEATRLFLPIIKPVPLPPMPASASAADPTTATRSTNDFTLLQMLQTATAWLFCWTCTIRVGSGTILTNNMGQMVESLHFHPRTASASLAFFSVAQALARVGVGTLSDAMADHVPRPAFLALSALIGIFGHGILAMAMELKLFLAGIILSGMAFGMIWPLMVLIVGEVFGTKHHGANYMFYDGFTSAIGTLAISKFLASAVYESHVEIVDGTIMGDTTIAACYGRACFGISHVIIVVLSVTCLATSIAVWTRTKSLYEKQIIGTPKMQRIRSNDELYGSPYKTWRKQDALRYK